jgi:hypothetical protein
MNKSIFLRKGLLYLNCIPRFINSISATKGDSILINSFPKSGTHLLYQVFCNQSFVKDYKVFIASMPTLSKKPSTESKIINSIKNITNNELVRSHIYYGRETDNILSKSCTHYFIYRDPREIVISEANYLYNMNRWHRLHKYFKRYSSLDNRIKFAILGNDFHNTDIVYKNINERFLDYIGWLDNPNVFSVRYEDLIGARKEETIGNILKYYISKTNLSLDMNLLMSNSMNSIDPAESHTFNTGGIDKWKKYFTNEHKDLFKQYAGDLLIKLGYEKDLNW